MIDDIHYQGALILFAGNTGNPGGVPGGGMPGGTGGGAPPEMASRTDDEILAEAKEHEKKGYDVYEINLSNPEAARKVRAATNLILMGRIRGAGRGGSIQKTLRSAFFIASQV